MELARMKHFQTMLVLSTVFIIAYIVYTFKDRPVNVNNNGIHFSVLADSMDAYDNFVERNNLERYNVTSTPFVCSVERGVQQNRYTHDCIMDHSKLNIKSNLIWNQLPIGFKYYFKVDSDVTLDMPELINQLNFYSKFTNKLVLGKVWRLNDVKFYLSGPFYGTNYPQNYSGNIESEDIQFGQNIPDNVFVVDWSTYYCGNAYPIKQSGACAILVRHGACEYENWAHCNIYYHYVDYHRLKTVGEIRNAPF
jgi:hypothetical protein